MRGNDPGEQPRDWTQAINNFGALVESEADWSRPTTCPGWTIADLVSHTIDLEAMLASDPRPQHNPDWSVLPHVKSDFGRITEVGVDYRRGRSKQELLGELTDAHSRARERIEALEPDASLPWLRGDTPLPQLLSMRTYDIWVHEQDIRIATGNNGNLTGPGSTDAMHYLTAGLPKVWGKGVGAPAGSVLHVRITEPGLTGKFWVQMNQDGKAAFIEKAADADVTVTLPWLSFVMLAGGRATETNFAESVVVTGNEKLGALLIDRMAVTP